MTWQRGDIAVCITEGVWYNGGEVAPGPRKNQYLTVRATGHDGRTYGLWFEEFPGTEEEDGFAAHNFRKVPPLTPDERREFLTDLDFDLEVADLQKAYRR